MYEGNGHIVDIPTLIIDEYDADTLFELYESAQKSVEKKQVILKADIDITDDQKETISYTLYYGSILDLDEGELVQMYDK